MQPRHGFIAVVATTMQTWGVSNDDLVIAIRYIEMTLTWGDEPMEAEADIRNVLDDGIHECHIGSACVEWMNYIRSSD